MGSLRRKLQTTLSFLDLDPRNSPNMAFACYESEEQVEEILKRLDEVLSVEFSEEEVTEYLHRDKQKEATVLEWIAKVIQEPLQGSVQIDFFLRDGVRICQLINKIKENSISKQEIITGNIEAHRKNIQQFLKAAGRYGVPEKYLFEVDDLLSLKCISRVTRCLYILAFLTSKDFAYHGPRMAKTTVVKEKKLSVPECDRANLANVNISNIFWNLMESAERRRTSYEDRKRRPSLVEF